MRAVFLSCFVIYLLLDVEARQNLIDGSQHTRDVLVDIIDTSALHVMRKQKKSIYQERPVGNQGGGGKKKESCKEKKDGARDKNCAHSS